MAAAQVTCRPLMQPELFTVYCLSCTPCIFFAALRSINNNYVNVLCGFMPIIIS